MRPCCNEVIEHRCPSLANSVSLSIGCWRTVGQAIHDYEDQRSLPPLVAVELHYEAALMIAPKEDGSSEAPPTSAPSMSDSAKNIAAFSGLTDPP